MISTQRYRLPVRRYIIELFNQEMDQNLVEGLHAAATKLQASPSYKPPKTDTFRMSVFGSKRTSEDDESDEDGDPDTPPARAKPPEEHPTINLQPLKKIVGFEVWQMLGTWSLWHNLCIVTLSSSERIVRVRVGVGIDLTHLMTNSATLPSSGGREPAYRVQFLYTKDGASIKFTFLRFHFHPHSPFEDTPFHQTRYLLRSLLLVAGFCNECNKGTRFGDSHRTHGNELQSWGVVSPRPRKVMLHVTQFRQIP